MDNSYYQWLYLRLGFGMYQTYFAAKAFIQKEQNIMLSAFQLLASLLTFSLLLHMIEAAESLIVIQFVRIIVGLDSLIICVGMTALVKAIFLNPAKSM